MEMVRAPVGLEPTIFGLKSAAVTNLATGARASLTTYRGAMDFSIPADIQALLNECDAFIDDVIVPIEAEDDNIRFFDHRREDARTDWDRDGLPNAEWEALLGRMRRSRCRRPSALPTPGSLRGRDGSNLAMAIVREHLARRGLGLHNDLQNESSIIGNFPTVLMMEKYGSRRSSRSGFEDACRGGTHRFRSPSRCTAPTPHGWRPPPFATATSG